MDSLASLPKKTKGYQYVTIDPELIPYVTNLMASSRTESMMLSTLCVTFLCNCVNIRNEMICSRVLFEMANKFIISLI